MDTIFALATARAKSGVAILRISGAAAFEVAAKLVQRLPVPGEVAYRIIRDISGAELDRGLVLVFQGPHSFTGEDTIEFQVHGSVAVISAIESAISATGLARPAEAGEFTRRALLNDRMDLGQVEALGDLIEAETEQQRLAAQASLEGGLRDMAEALRRDLLRARMLVEATIDFADEDVPEDVSGEVSALLRSVSLELVQQISGISVAERLRNGFEVAIVGLPNVGKSTLLNRIAGRDLAISSEIAGTTRDVLEARVDVNGLPVTFLDTAGLRDNAEDVERIGIERARLRARYADMRVFLLDGPEMIFPELRQDHDLELQAKADSGATVGGISGLTGAGVSDMLRHVEVVLRDRLAGMGFANRARHRAELSKALALIEDAERGLLNLEVAPELTAEALASACRALDALTGRIDVEAVLGEIFAGFCIGK